MANNKKVFKEVSKTIDKTVECYKKDVPEMKRLATKILEQIRKRTRLGFGVTTTGAKRKLEKLSTSYKDARRGKVRFFKNKNGKLIAAKGKSDFTKPKRLASSTKPSKSNLTATGLMLDSLTRVVRSKRIIISIENARGSDLYGNSSNVTTNEKAKFQENAGRRFMDLANFEIKIFGEKIRKDIIKLSNKKLKNF
jgi:hypothetical protein